MSDAELVNLAKKAKEYAYVPYSHFRVGAAVLTSEGEVFTQGQTEKVIIHHLTVEGGVDEDVVAALANKTSTQDSLMAALKARIERVQEGAHT
jgi:hypothetical protein